MCCATVLNEAVSEFSSIKLKAEILRSKDVHDTSEVPLHPRFSHIAGIHANTHQVLRHGRAPLEMLYRECRRYQEIGIKQSFTLAGDLVWGPRSSQGGFHSRPPLPNRSRIRFREAGGRTCSNEVEISGAEMDKCQDVTRRRCVRICYIVMQRDEPNGAPFKRRSFEGWLLGRTLPRGSRKQDLTH